VVYGVKPEHGQEIINPSTNNRNFNSAFGERLIKWGVSDKEIKVIYVPEQHVQETKEYLEKHGQNIPVESHDFSPHGIGETPASRTTLDP
jgi:hypothetical protein